MGKTSNRSDFGTEGNEGNKGPNDFVALIDLVADFFLDFGRSLPIHRLGRLEFIWGLDFWCLGFGSGRDG
jgi:hypothetical protein